MTDDTEHTTLHAGDTMRISVALIRQIDEEGDGTSPMVRVRQIRLEADGTKTLVLEKIPTPNAGAPPARKE